MHVLVVNDDGPPSQLSSPYVHSFIKELQDSGAIVSVCLPHTQRSWIGKAHIAHTTVKPTYFRPGTLHTDDGTTHALPRADGGEEWVLIDGTPASCVQIGLYHYFQNKGPVDLVVSGPNYGRNSTSIFSLSSGTIGGALEGAVCQKKSIAISYAFNSRNHDPVQIKGASQLSVRLIKHLYDNWSPDVHLYSVNVPLAIDHTTAKLLYTSILQNHWSSGSSFEEIDVPDDETPQKRELELREGAEKGNDIAGEAEGSQKGHKHKLFKWAPKFKDVHQSVETSQPGNDGWAVKEGHVSITPLKANFMHVAGFEGELELQDTGTSRALPILKKENETTGRAETEAMYAVVDYEDDYVQPKIITALQERIPRVKIISSVADAPQGSRVLQWSAYEKIDFDRLLAHPETALACTYIIRKALIRKHYLTNTIMNHLVKFPGGTLSTAYAETYPLELDYAEFLDEAMQEAYELEASLTANSEKNPESRQWWILKPSMSDRGQGIRLFSTIEELQAIFESFEEDSDSDSDGGESPEAPDVAAPPTTTTTTTGAFLPSTSVITNQMRHFICQSYIHPPLLISNRKFHIRTYVLSAGSLSVFVYRPMLALFAGPEYIPPWDLATNTDLSPALTNTCLQNGAREGTVRLFWDLATDVPGGKQTLQHIWDRICKITAEVFEAAAREQRVHFQTLPNTFEIFGLDFLVGEDGKAVVLLEVNSYPDFRQTGEERGGVITGLVGAVVGRVVKPFLMGRGMEEENEDLVKVLDVELGKF